MKMSADNILRIVCARLLERKVIVLFRNYQQNAVIMESIISLLTPLYVSLSYSKWNFLNVSYMTSELSDSLDAPIPYFIGISPYAWKQVFLLGYLGE